MQDEKGKTKWYNKRILCIPIWAVGLAILVAAVGYAQQQTLQLTTYYPAPYGEYTQLKVAQKLEVLPTAKLQATRGVGTARDGLEIDLTKGPFYIQMSDFFDINNMNYNVDPNQLSVLKQLRIEKGEVSGDLKFGRETFDRWPVLVYKSHKDISRPTPAKIYFGTAQTGGRTDVVIRFSSFSLMNSDYFVMISPRELYSPVWLSGRTSHNTGHRHHRLERLTTNFNYYKVKIQKHTVSFLVTFEGTIPAEFDWVVIWPG